MQLNHHQPHSWQTYSIYASRFLTIVTPSKNIFVVCSDSDGELLKIINVCKSFSEQDTVDIVRQMVKGLRYLHNNGIAHHDIKVTK